MHLEPHDYQIYYVNIALRHQYGISVAESQMFLLAKRPSAAMSGGEMSAIRRLRVRVTVIYAVVQFYSWFNFIPLYFEVW